jgi:hypothetical protein
MRAASAKSSLGNFQLRRSWIPSPPPDPDGNTPAHQFTNLISEFRLNFYRLPRQHHKNLKSTNMLERLMEEIKRRTLVVRIFPNPAACLRLVRALAAETHENWIEAMQYLNMEPLKEQKKEALRKLGDAA